MNMLYWSFSCWLVSKSCLTLVTPWTVAHQAPLSVGFPRKEYWSGLPFPPAGHIPDPGIEPRSPAWQVSSLPLSHQGRPLTILKMKTKVAQSCQILCNHIDYTVHEIIQARILKWVAHPFSRGSSQPRDWTQVSHRFFTRWATREAHFTSWWI